MDGCLSHVSGRQPFLLLVPLDHVHDFGLNPSIMMNVIDSKSLERDAGGKSVPLFLLPLKSMICRKAADFLEKITR
jgi:hypothetical protein